MRSALLLTALLLFTACADSTQPLLGGGEDPAVTWPGATRCIEGARPSNCRQERRPVCGRRENGSRRTYANSCEACANPAVIDHKPGSCPN